MSFAEVAHLKALSVLRDPGQMWAAPKAGNERLPPFSKACPRTAGVIADGKQLSTVAAILNKPVSSSSSSTNRAMPPGVLTGARVHTVPSANRLTNKSHSEGSLTSSVSRHEDDRPRALAGFNGVRYCPDWYWPKPKSPKEVSDNAIASIAFRQTMGRDFAHSTGFRHPFHAQLEPDDLPSSHESNDLRDALRRAFIKAAGGAREAFQVLDLSGSGSVSLSEFCGGVSALGTPWEAITGFSHINHVFQLFDDDRCGSLDYEKVFPRDADESDPRATTPGFWNHWIGQNRDMISTSTRNPCWTPKTKEDGLNLLIDDFKTRDEMSARKTWMRATFRRLKRKGKSDARCREILASHLPKGTGPKDRDSCPSFSHKELHECKKSYHDQLTEATKKIEKGLITMREQRRLLQTSRQKLLTVAQEPPPELRRDSAGLSMATEMYFSPRATSK